MPTRREWISFYLLLSAVLAVAYGAGLGNYVWREFSLPQAAPGPAFTPLWEVLDHVRGEFYGPLPGDQALAYAAIRGLLAEVDDPYTVLVDPRPHQEQTEQLHGSYGGIGATLSRDETGRVRLAPFAESPAAQAGIALDDVLVAIDAVPVQPADTIDALNDRLRGEVGSPVTLTVRQARGAGLGAPVELVVLRAEIIIPSVSARLLREDERIGYLAISRFSEKTVDEVRATITTLRAAGAQALVLDLRNNGGGLLQSAIDVSSQFLDGGVVLYELRREGAQFFPVEAGGVATDLDLVVLVNGSSASATEVVAGALQDTGRALLVGERTYGKGSVQFIYELADGSSLHVTTATWQTPHRRSIDGTGLAPDVPVAFDPAAYEAGRDPQLLRAIEILQAKQERK